MNRLQHFLLFIENIYILMIHKPLSPDIVHPQISASLRLFLSFFLFVWTWSSYITVELFFKERISIIGSIDKCHTSVFNALIKTMIITKIITYVMINP